MKPVIHWQNIHVNCVTLASTLRNKIKCIAFVVQQPTIK
jgi:hypothetical protein